MNQCAVIGANSRVFAHITIYLEDGSIADSTKSEGKPSVIQMGDGSMSPAFERCLIGQSAGNSQKIKLNAADAFGNSDPNLIQFLDLHQFRQ